MWIPSRLVKHSGKHNYPQAPENDTDTPITPKQRKINSFVVRTTHYDKVKFDKALGKTFFACNISFRAVENKQFHGSRPPRDQLNRHCLAKRDGVAVSKPWNGLLRTVNYYVP